MPTGEDEQRRLQQVFEHYQHTRDTADREDLIRSHIRLAIHLARRFDHRGIPIEDLEQVASLGLVKAVDRFEPDRGIAFSSFATPTIVGELKRHFRDRGWSVHVPRRIQELHLRLATAVDDLTHRLGRSPTIAELARAARTSEEEVLEAMDAAHAYRSASFDTGWPGAEKADAVDHCDDLLFAAINRVFVDQLLDQLPPREQLIVRMRFYEEMTQSEIADRLGLSQMQISRLLDRCLDLLRSHIETNRYRPGPGER